MSKKSEKYQALALALGFHYDAANEVIYGQKDGYDLLVYAGDKNYPYMMTIFTVARSTDGTTLTKDEIKALKKSTGVIGSITQEGNRIVVATASQNKTDKWINGIAESISGLTILLRQKGYFSCCSTCNQNVEVSFYQAAGIRYALCPECEARMRNNMELLEQQKKQKKENLVGGIVGALLGSLLGVLCIILLSRMGYVAAISGVVMAVCVLKGYELLGGKLTKKGIVFSVIIMLLMTYVGDRLDWAIILLGEGGGAEAGFTFFDCYQLVPELVAEEFITSSDYYTNLVMLYLFLLLGAVPTVISKIKEKGIESKLVKISHNTGYEM